MWCTLWSIIVSSSLSTSLFNVVNIIYDRLDDVFVCACMWKNWIDWWQQHKWCTLHSDRCKENRIVFGVFGGNSLGGILIFCICICVQSKVSNCEPIAMIIGKLQRSTHWICMQCAAMVNTYENTPDATASTNTFIFDSFLFNGEAFISTILLRCICVYVRVFCYRSLVARMCGRLIYVYVRAQFVWLVMFACCMSLSARRSWPLSLSVFCSHIR